MKSADIKTAISEWMNRREISNDFKFNVYHFSDNINSNETKIWFHLIENGG